MSRTAALDEGLIGRVLGGKFRLRSRVGAGSSGAVYRADQTALGRTVAVKVLNPEMARDPRVVRRFHDEALAASRLNHPNTVSVIDYGQSKEGLLYIAMEYLQGVTLHRLIEKESPLASARIVDVISQVLSGLEEAHHAGVIHADLKSDNIMVERRRGGWDLVKVLDFGIARLVEVPPHEDSKRALCGTPEYMAPELASGAEPSVASDLYAVGVVLYEMLVGEPPFEGGDPFDVLARHAREEPIPPSIKRPGRAIPKALEDVALRALAKKPEERFASAVAFSDALAAAWRHEQGAVEATIRCEGCGVRTSMGFKFCPECGYPIVAGLVVEVLSDATTEPHVAAGQAQRAGMPDHDTDVDLHAPALQLGGWPLPLVGRDQVLERAMGFIAGHETAMLAIVGSDGCGRSRLMDEIEAHAAALPGTAVYRTGPDPSGLGAPLYPIRMLVTRILSISPGCAYDSLNVGLEALGLTRRDLPGIAELFGHYGELWQLDPGVRRREVLASTMRVFWAAARRSGCVVLVLEGVDRYDQPSQEVLGWLAQHGAGDGDASRLRILVTHGPEFGHAWQGGVERIDIGPLDDDELAAMAVYLERTGIEGMPTAAQLAAHTDRMPGYIDHLARFAAEGGSVERAPRTMTDLIAERIHALPQLSRVLCQTAAVFGDEVSRHAMLSSLGPRLGESFDYALSVLKTRGILLENRGQETIVFCSHLVREVVYDATPAELRRELHARAVQAFEQGLKDPLILGHHSAMAGNLVEAATLLARAGDDAVRLLDHSGATQLYHRALEAARALMLSGDDSESRHRFVVLSVKLADALRVSGQIALARGIVAEAHGYSDGNPRLEAQLLRTSALLWQGEGQVEAAISALRRGMGFLIQAGETALLSEMYLDLASIHMTNEDAEMAIAELSEGIDVVTMGEGRRAAEGPEILWRLLLRLAELHGSTGNHDRALELAESALIHARRVRSRLGSARIQATLAMYYERVCNIPLAEQYRQAAVSEMRRLGDRRGTAELLLAGEERGPRLGRRSLASLREAQELAAEVGWSEGVALVRAKIK